MNRLNEFTTVSEDGTEIYINDGTTEIDLSIERAEELLLDLGDALNLARWKRDNRA
jgi:hypothetical protein